MVLGSKFYTPFKKNVDSNLQKSHQLLLKSGLIYQIGSGLFTFLPLGLRVLKNIKSIVSQHHKDMGFNEILIPTMQPADIWIKGGRYDSYGKETISLRDRHDKEYILGPTAELACADALDLKNNKNQLPIQLFNIQTKFRDEMRPRCAMLRAKEFIMSDGYSFHLSEEAHLEFYNDVKQKYELMFDALGIRTYCVAQEDTGEIGGNYSHEFFVQSNNNEQLEVGHIFDLGNNYLSFLNLGFDVYMGCYGVGVSRLLSIYAEVHNDVSHNNVEYIKWPKSVAPFKIYLAGTDKTKEICSKIHNLDPNKIYYRDQNERFSEKLAISRLIGAQHEILVGDKELESGQILIDGASLSLEGDFLAKISSLLEEN